MLTDAECRNAICPPGRKQARFSDAGGLYLQVSPNASKRWFWKYRIGGTEKQLALGSYPVRSNLITVVGLAYSRSFGRDRLFPALGATWIPAPRWQLDLVFPRPRVVYQASERSKYYVGVEPGGDEWNIELPEGSRDLALSEFRGGAGAEWMLTSHLGLVAQGGAVFARDIEVRNGRKKDYEVDLGDTWFARIGLLYR